MPKDIDTDIFGGKEETAEKEDAPKVKRKPEREPSEVLAAPRKPRIDEEIIKRQNDQIEFLKKQVEKMNDKLLECSSNDDRLELLENVASTWESIKKSELSKWSRPADPNVRNRGSTRALKFVENLDKFITRELEKARRTKKVCEEK